jgi:hypothetical protein
VEAEALLGTTIGQCGLLVEAAVGVHGQADAVEEGLGEDGVLGSGG